LVVVICLAAWNFGMGYGVGGLDNTDTYKINTVKVLWKGATAIASNLFVGNGGESVAAGSANNTVVGVGAGTALTTGTNSTLVGKDSGIATTGSSNTSVGASALYANVSGANNTAVGQSASLNVAGSGNVAVGYNAGSYETGSNSFYVDNQSRGNTANEKAQALLYGVFAADPANQVLTVNAKVGINTTAPGSSYSGAANIVVSAIGAADAGMTILTDTTHNGFICFADGTAGNAPLEGFIEYNHSTNAMYIATSHATVLTLSSAGVMTVNNLASGNLTSVSGVITSSSDSRLKTALPGEYVYGLPEILRLTPRRFEWKASKKADFGFFAQEAGAVIPEALGEPGKDGMYGLYDRPIIAALVKAVQDQQTMIDNLRARLDKLEKGK
jgi:hypothetical protein